jgi:tetratricopeptide (TPR) repeat protein
MLRESLLRRGDHDAAEQTLDELAKLYPAPASWEPWELHLAAIAQPSHWRPVTEVPPEGADQLLRLLCRRGRLAFLLGDLPRLEQALNDLKAAPDPKWRPQRTRAASVAFLELARATLRGEEAPEVATRVERNRDIEPFARDALLARFHLALGDAPTAEGYINRLSVPQDDRPDTPPRLWLKRLLEIELMQLRGQDDEAREAVGRIVLRDTPCATDYLDDTQPCRAHAAEAYVLQAELEDDPAKVRRALAKLDALWPAPDPELPLVKRTRAARKRSP